MYSRVPGPIQGDIAGASELPVLASLDSSDVVYVLRNKQLYVTNVSVLEALGGSSDAARLTSGRLRLAVLPKLDLARNAAQCVDERIGGLTPASAKPIYSVQDHAAGSYVRNTGCWAYDLDLTAISPWNAHYGAELAGVAVSPRHIVLAEHFVASSGLRSVLPKAFRWVTRDNVVVTRNLTQVLRVGGTDLAIGLLDSDLPSSITPAKVLPTNWSDYLTLNGLPLLAVDKEEKALVFDIESVNSAVNAGTPTDGTRALFHETLVTGDSGSPFFLVLGGEPVIVSTAYFGSSGPALSVHADAINAVMDSLGGGYALTRLDLSALRQITSWGDLAGVPTSQFIPAGGTAGQVLKKSSGSDYAVEWSSSEVGSSWDSVTGKPFNAVSTGGNGAADAGKGVVYNDGGGIRLTNTGSDTGAALIIDGAFGTRAQMSIGDDNRAFVATSYAGTPVIANAGATGDLLSFQSGNGDPSNVLSIRYDGSLAWADEAGRAATRADLAAPAVKVKTTTGDPAAPSGGEPTIYINTFDNAAKIYADGAWRTLVTW